MIHKLLCAFGIHEWERISGYWKRCIICGRSKKDYGDNYDVGGYY